MKIWLESPDAKLPTRGTDKAQCLDFYSAEDVTLLPGETKVVDLGLRMLLPEGYGFKFHERSGLATKGIIIGAGIIDEDYRGPLKVVVRYMHCVPPTDGNFIPAFEPFTIAKGDKIVQGELFERKHYEVVEIDAAAFEQQSDTERGEGGFGSTGK
jgi:dUTP pyrophosphatase